jgi:hypothetical protein
MDCSEAQGLAFRTALSCDGGACVQIASAQEVILVRDSVGPSGPPMFPSAKWRAFISRAKGGEFDNPAG